MKLLEIIPKEVVDTLDKEQIQYVQEQYELLSDDYKQVIAELKKYGFVYWKDGIESIQFRLNMDTEDDMSETSIDVVFYEGCMSVYLVHQAKSGERYIPTEMTGIYQVKDMYGLITGGELKEVNNGNDKPRPISEEEARDEFLGIIKSYVECWANTPSKTTKERLDGLAFSILCIFDGVAPELPAMDVVLRPHEKDEEFCKATDINWYVDGQVINDCMLHELYYGKGGE